MPQLLTPLALLLLIPLLGVALVAGDYLSGRAAGASRRTTVLSLRCGALILLTLALAQPVWSTDQRSASLLVVADASALHGADGGAAELSALQSLLRAAGDGGTRTLVSFGGAATVTAIPKGADANWLRRALATTADPGADLEGALRLGLGAAQAGTHVVLLSDGWQTSGDARAVIVSAQSRHIPIDVLPLSVTPGPDAALTRLAAPARVHTGDPVPLQITVWSDHAGSAVLSVSQDGQSVGRQSVTLRVGDNTFLVSLGANGTGSHSYHAAITLPGDTDRLNDALDVVTRVVGRPRVLLVGQKGGATVSAGLLRTLGVDVQVATPAALPSSPPPTPPFDAVVLDDLPATALSARQSATLGQMVRGGGVGLLVLGGAHSLTLGHYSQTPLEALLPVLSDTPGSLEQGNLALQLVLDRSGSMDNLAGDVPKILMSRGAANIAVDFALQHQDQLGIVSFDVASHLLAPLQHVDRASAAHLRTIIGGMTADGGTNIFVALRKGLQQVGPSSAPYKHIILMTDGRSEPASYDTLLTQLQQAHVTLSTVGLGPDADVSLLRYLAAKGKGRFYYTTNARELPQIFAEDSRISAGPSRITGRIPAAIGASSSLVRSLGAAALPPVRGYVVTVRKPDATNDLLAQAPGRDPDPLLTHWQYGLGRVAVWTPGLGIDWAGTWATGQAALWGDTLHWLLRGVSATALEPHLLADGTTTDGPPMVVVDTLQNAGSALDLLHLQGTALLPSGGARRLALTQVAPGRYEAPLPDGGPGVYRLSVGRGDPSSTVSALVAVPYNRAYAPRRADHTLLADLAAGSGGRVLAGAADLRPSGTSASTSRDLWWLPALCALALFVCEIAIRQSGWGRHGGGI